MWLVGTFRVLLFSSQYNISETFLVDVTTKWLILCSSCSQYLLLKLIIHYAWLVK